MLIPVTVIAAFDMRVKNHTSAESVHFRAVYAYAATGIIITNSEGSIVAINRYALKKFGYKKSELLGRKIQILVPDRFKRKHAGYHKAFIENPRTRLMSNGQILSAKKKNGKEFPVEINLTNYRVNGKIYVLAFISDVTSRKVSEEKIERLNDTLEATVEKRTGDLQKALARLEVINDKLHETVSFQKAILENAGAIIISCNTQGIIQVFNPEAEAELGYSAEELIGHKTPLIFHLADELKSRAKEISMQFHTPITPDMEVFFAKAKRGMHNEDEWTYQRKDGTLFPVLLNVTALYSLNKEIIGYLGVAVNITQHKKSEQSLQQALNKERELSELKAKFVSIASHEFRTPLSTISSSAFLIEQYRQTEEQAKRELHLKNIMEAVNMLTDILNDFLSVGKIEENRVHVREVLFNIKSTTQRIIEEIKFTLKPGQAITYKHTGTQEVCMDEILLKHILMNLVSNAGKFSGDDGKIKVDTAVLNGKVTLTVTDNGIGITEEDQKHLAERFFRGTNAANIQGTGLGLHIVSKYAALMNGIVSCKSSLGKGASFKIVFHSKTKVYEKDSFGRR
ncbi:MAG TPA: PAS domain-containing sensor histidine kinase [Lacibacter sp.]|nr:PAS domain-containing sensor histidine kinase [Lacibacter sp.]